MNIFPAVFPLIIMFGLTQDGSQDGKLLIRSIANGLNSDDAKTKTETAIKLGQIGSGLRTASLQLGMIVINDRDPAVRARAALAIAEIGPSARYAIPQLIKGLDDKDEQVRLAVIRAIGGTAPFSKNAITKLKAMFRDKNAVVRREIVSALRQFGSDAREAIPLLMAALDDPDQTDPNKQLSVSKLAILTLGDMGEDAYAAIDALVKIKESADPQTRALALGALAKMMPKDPRLLPMLIEDLKNAEHKNMRAGAAHAIGFLGPKAKEAVPALIKALKADDVEDRKLDSRIKVAIVYALSEIGPAAKVAIPAIQYAINNTTDELLIVTGRDAIQTIEGGK